MFIRNNFANIVQEKEEEGGGGEGLMLCSRITAEVKGNATVIRTEAGFKSDFSQFHYFLEQGPYFSLASVSSPIQKAMPFRAIKIVKRDNARKCVAARSPQHAGVHAPTERARLRVTPSPIWPRPVRVFSKT